MTDLNYYLNRKGNKVDFFTDDEGGNISIISPGGTPWEMDAFNENFRLFSNVPDKWQSFTFSTDGYLSSTKGLFLTDQSSNVAFLDKSGTFTQRMWMGNNASLFTDNEGGNLVLVSPNGSHWHMDALTNSILRFYYGNSSSEVIRMININGDTGELTGCHMDLNNILNIPAPIAKLGSQFYFDGSSPWGNTAGTHWYGLGCEGGCSLALLKDNPNPGQLSLKLDGVVYQNEGANKVLDTSNFVVSGNTLTITL